MSVTPLQARQRRAFPAGECKLRVVVRADTASEAGGLRTLLMMVHPQRHDRFAVASRTTPRPNITNKDSARIDNSSCRCGNPCGPAQRPRRISLPRSSCSRIDKGQEKEFVFVDGGVTVYNNPAFQLFLMATLDRYRPGRTTRWKAGAERMLTLSVSTGTAPNVRNGLDPRDMHLLYNARPSRPP